MEMSLQTRRWPSGPALTKALIALYIFVIGAAVSAEAQSYFEGAEQPIAISNNPYDVAVDSSGNIYAVGFATSVLKVTSSGTESNIGSGLSAEGLTIDSANNLYIADGSNNRVVEISANGTQSVLLSSNVEYPTRIARDSAGDLYILRHASANGSSAASILMVSAGGIETSIGTGLSTNLTDVATDSSGNVYILDSGNGEVVELSTQGTQSIVAKGLIGPTALTVDYSGNLYVSGICCNTENGSDSYVFEVSSTGIQTTLLSSFDGEELYSPLGLAVDAQGSLYVADYGNDRILKLYLGSVTFGTVAVGASSSKLDFDFNFPSLSSGWNTDPYPSVQPFRVLSEGMIGSEFTSAPPSGCIPRTVPLGGVIGSTGGICFTEIQFTPKYSGLRTGAVDLLDPNGNILLTVHLSGIGVAPQVAYDPGTQNTIMAQLNAPTGTAVDGASNVYFSESGNNRVLKLQPSGDESVLVESLSHPAGVALDGAGNLYVADSGNDRILKISPDGNQSTVLSGLYDPMGIALDGLGDLFVADTGNNRIIELTPSGTQSSVGSGLIRPQGVTVDSSENVYIADSGNNRILKIPLDEVEETLSTSVRAPAALALDPVGNIYVADAGNNRILKIALTGIQSTVKTSVQEPTGIALDGAGNIYITDTGDGTVLKLDRTTVPNLSFASTLDGMTSTDSPQAISLENIGNAVLSFSVPGLGVNPAISTNFSLGNSTTCPVLYPSSVEGSLTSGDFCTYLISFTASVAGDISGMLAVTDNALNSNFSYGTQTIQLSGFSTGAVNIGNLQQTYTGAALPVSVVTNPVGLTVSVSYNGSAMPPVTAGSYSVVATINEAGYQGSATGILVISKASPKITWANPAPITPGTVLTFTQLNASASVAGSFTYSPAAGIVLITGENALTATFTPSDITDYSTIEQAVSILVESTTSDFGAVIVGTTSKIFSVPFRFIAATTLGATTPFQVLTLGAPGGDFANAETGSCIGTAYTAGNSCSVNVTFTPSLAGERGGAIVLEDESGNAVQTVFIHGLGQGPQAVFDPGTQTTLPGTGSIAVDNAGDIYIGASALSGDNMPVNESEEYSANGSLIRKLGSLDVLPSDIAIDAAGNVYLATSGNLVKVTPMGVQNTLSFGQNFVSVDAFGDILTQDQYGDTIKVDPFGTQTQVTHSYQIIFGDPMALPNAGKAVGDPYGNVYVIDPTNGRIVKVSPQGTQETFVSGLSQPTGIAIDGSGSIYIAASTAYNHEFVSKISSSGNNIVLANELSSLGAIAVDGAGRVYVSEHGDILKIDRSVSPTLMFASAIEGMVSADSPRTFTVDNIGTTNLSFPKASAGTNPSISASFAVAGPTTCPQLTDSTESMVLPSGDNCSYAVNFIPMVSGTVSGSLNLTDNTLNAATPYATQEITLNGTATPAPIVSMSSASLNFASQSHAASRTRVIRRVP